MENHFMFSLPLDVLKSSNQDATEMRIGGYASTPDQDRQGDCILQKGLDISEFVENGWFNYDHDNSKILGYPDAEKTRVDAKGFYVEGVLLPESELACSMYKTAVSLAKCHAPRKLGFSVEGQVLRRDDKGKILKAKIYNVAITPNPVNTNATWDALMKSFAGYETPIGEVNTGQCLKTEDLEDAFQLLAKACGEDEACQQAMKLLREKLSAEKSLTRGEQILYLQLAKGFSREVSCQLVSQLEQSLKEEQ